MAQVLNRHRTLTLAPNPQTGLVFLIEPFLCLVWQLLAAATPSADIALSLYPLTFIFFNVFAGFLIHLPNVSRLLVPTFDTIC